MPIAERRPWPVIGASGVLLLAAGLAAAGSARAAPLDQAACDKLLTEHAELVKAGAPEAMRKGPAWAKTNLPVDKVAAIERFIGLEEQLLFRCGQDKARAQPEPEAADAAAGAAAAGADNKGQAAAKGPRAGSEGQKAPAARQSASKGASPAKGRPATDAEAEPKAQPKAQPKAKPRPKPKVDDAYRPPQAAPAAPIAAPSAKP